MMEETNQNKNSFSGMFLSQFFAILTLLSGYIICFYLSNFLHHQYNIDYDFAHKSIENLQTKHMLKKDMITIKNNIQYFVFYSLIMVNFEVFRLVFDILHYRQNNGSMNKHKFDKMVNQLSEMSKTNDRKFSGKSLASTQQILRESSHSNLDLKNDSTGFNDIDKSAEKFRLPNKKSSRNKFMLDAEPLETE